MSVNTTLEEISVNPSSVVQMTEKYQQLLEDVLSREITLGTTWSMEQDIEKLMKYFQDFTEVLMQLGNQSQ